MIGERLRKIRKSKGITQKELADVLGVNKATVSLYEKNINEPNDSVKTKMAKYFKISMDYLTGVIDEEISYYDKNTFLKLSSDISKEDIRFINEIMEFISFRQNQRNDDLFLDLDAE